MVTVVWATLPASDFALSEAFSVAPDATFECERIIETGSETVMPLLWARGVDRETVEQGFERDHSVDGFERLASFEDEGLYRMTWIRRVRLVLQILSSTRATVLDAVGDNGQWTLRIMYPQRSELSETNEFCEQHRLSFSVERIRELSDEVVGQYGLTDEQFDALTIACEAGYFDVPRAVDLDDLATELGISHQALSERLRRGHEVLIEETLLIDGPSHLSIRSN